MNGILVLDKPEGITSMTAVSIVRRKVSGGKRAKVGHAGTLDPLATGVLVIAIGKATAALSRLMETDKHYHTVIDLSALTTTDDREGPREEIAVMHPPSHHEVLAALERFTGEFQQRPPSYSAVKIDGRRAYALARKGDAVAIPSRTVHVRELHLRRYQWPMVELDLRCAKGFYVRSLARDLGKALGSGGHCASIRRTEVGRFTLEMAKCLADVPDRLREEDLISLDRALDLTREAAPRAGL
jgi:tRNA pseudouridine55 synthase